MVIRNVGIITRCYNPEDLDLNLYPSPTYFTLKEEAARSSETLVSYNTTLRHNPDLGLNLHSSENLNPANCSLILLTKCILYMHL
jgi:hypothetical protein